MAHPSERPARELAAVAAEDLAGADLVITTYGQVPRLPWLGEAEWNLLVLDEAQAIKNPATKQARAVKRLRSRARVALTGTPIENRLSDLWSLFDFLNPGLLGSARAFTRVTRELAAGGDRHYGPLRALVRPYILRRLKTDRRVIADLPDKTEVRAYCPPHPEAGRPLPAGGEGARAAARRGGGHRAARRDPRHPPAPQADLQPSLAVARRRRLRARPERQVRPAGRAGRGAGARDRRRCSCSPSSAR